MYLSSHGMIDYVISTIPIGIVVSSEKILAMGRWDRYTLGAKQIGHYLAMREDMVRVGPGLWKRMGGKYDIYQEEDTGT